MIQASDIAHVNSNGPLWAARAFGAPGGARPGRAQQSAAAAALLAELAVAAGAGGSCKAHSRHWAAAAIASSGRVGVDLEFCAPERPIIEIAAWLMGERPANRLAGWRAFTFYEAYFKAVGEAPTRALMQEIAGASTALTRLPSGLGVLYESLAEDFALTLVWDGPGTPRRALD